MNTLPVEGTIVRTIDDSHEAIFITFSKDLMESLIDDNDDLVWVPTNDLLFV